MLRVWEEYGGITVLLVYHALSHVLSLNRRHGSVENATRRNDQSLETSNAHKNYADLYSNSSRITSDHIQLKSGGTWTMRFLCGSRSWVLLSFWGNHFSTCSLMFSSQKLHRSTSSKPEMKRWGGMRREELCWNTAFSDSLLGCVFINPLVTSGVTEIRPSALPVFQQEPLERCTLCGAFQVVIHNKVLACPLVSPGFWKAACLISDISRHISIISPSHDITCNGSKFQATWRPLEGLRGTLSPRRIQPKGARLVHQSLFKYVRKRARGRKNKEQPQKWNKQSKAENIRKNWKQTRREEKQTNVDFKYAEGRNNSPKKYRGKMQRQKSMQEKRKQKGQTDKKRKQTWKQEEDIEQRQKEKDIVEKRL